MSELSPLSGVKLKSDFGTVRAALDPKLTFRPEFAVAENGLSFLPDPTSYRRHRAGVFGGGKGLVSL